MSRVEIEELAYCRRKTAEKITSFGVRRSTATLRSICGEGKGLIMIVWKVPELLVRLCCLWIFPGVYKRTTTNQLEGGRRRNFACLCIAFSLSIRHLLRPDTDQKVSLGCIGEDCIVEKSVGASAVFMYRHPSAMVTRDARVVPAASIFGRRTAFVLNFYSKTNHDVIQKPIVNLVLLVAVNSE